jgi:hypothetical protein
LQSFLAEIAGWDGQRWLVEILGWSGAVLVLLAYLLLSMGKVTGRSTLYHGMNIAGAAGFAVNGWWHGAAPSATLNVIWLMIGVFALWRIGKGSSTSAI